MHNLASRLRRIEQARLGRPISIPEFQQASRAYAKSGALPENARLAQLVVKFRLASLDMSLMTGGVGQLAEEGLEGFFGSTPRPSELHHVAGVLDAMLTKCEHETCRAAIESDLKFLSKAAKKSALKRGQRVAD